MMANSFFLRRCMSQKKCSLNSFLTYAYGCGKVSHIKFHSQLQGNVERVLKYKQQAGTFNKEAAEEQQRKENEGIEIVSKRE